MARKEIMKKIEDLEHKKFMLDMKDRWSREDLDLSAHLIHEIRELKRLLDK